MTAAWKQRRRRHKLAAHDRGEDRHNRGLAWIKKSNRLRQERRAGKVADGQSGGRLTVSRPLAGAPSDVPTLPRCQQRPRGRSPRKIYDTEALAQAMCSAVQLVKGIELAAWHCQFADHWHIAKADDVARKSAESSSVLGVGGLGSE